MLDESDFLVFVVTPSYNQGQFLDQTLNSVYSQIQDKGFYFVADGGSSDNTPSLLLDFAKNKSDFDYYSKPDGGQVNAINAGIARMKTWAAQNKIALAKVLFLYLNSDDVLSAEAIDEQIAAFRTHPEINWAVGDCKNVDSENQEIQQLVRLYKSANRWLLNMVGRSWLYLLNPIPQPSVVLRADKVVQLGDFNPSLHFTMDYEYWLRFWKAFGKPYFSTHVWSHFRIHATAKGTLDNAQQFAEQLKVAHDQGASWAWLFGQKLHNWIITTVYQFIKTHD